MRQLQFIDIVAPIHHHWFFSKAILHPFDQNLILNWRHVLQHDCIRRRAQLFIGQDSNILNDNGFEEDNDEKDGDGCGHIDYFCSIEIGLFCYWNIDDGKAEESVAGSLGSALEGHEEVDGAAWHKKYSHHYRQEVFCQFVVKRIPNSKG